MKSISFFILFIIFFTLECTMEQGILNLLPDKKELSGWKETEGRVLSTVQEMSDYMNGGAELYFAYNFSQLGLKKFINEDNLEIVVELYEMKDNECAYGVLSFDLSGKRVDTGTIGIYDLGLLRFWKGKYFCRILMWQGFEDNEETIFKISKIIEKNIGHSEDEIPELVNLLPSQGLIENSIHYFFHNNPLNNFYYISSENIFNLGENAKAVIADYVPDENGKFYLMIIRYKYEIKGFEAYKKFLNVYFNQDISEQNKINDFLLIRNIKGEDFTGIDLKGNYMIIVFEAKTKSVCINYLNETFVKIRIINR